MDGNEIKKLKKRIKNMAERIKNTDDEGRELINELISFSMSVVFSGLTNALDQDGEHKHVSTEFRKKIASSIIAELQLRTREISRAVEGRDGAELGDYNGDNIARSLGAIAPHESMRVKVLEETDEVTSIEVSVGIVASKDEIKALRELMGQVHSMESIPKA